MPDRRSPERALEELLFGGSLDRRRFLGRAGASALALSSMSTVLAACGGVKGESANNQAADKPAAANHPKTAIDTIVWSNWPLYIDKKTLKQFDAKFGANVRYIEDINDNYEFYGKVRQQLQRGQSIGRDLVTLSDYMAARWVRDGYVEALDKRNIPNVKNLSQHLQSINYDPQRTYTLPWQSFATGIGYNIKKTGGEIKSIDALFDPKFKGKVTMLADPYDSSGLTMLSQGVDPSKATIDQILAAIQKIDEANKKGQFRRFTGNDYSTDLTKGNVWIAAAYSGDLVQLSSDNPDLRFVYPDEGALLGTDNFMIPQKAEHPYPAEVLMNYYYEPAVAAKVVEYVNYISPVEGVKELAPKLADNPLIFPTDDVRRRLHAYPSLKPADERKMQEEMAKVIGA